MSLSSLLIVETHLLGTWWSRRYPCVTGVYIRGIAATILHGCWLWLFVRGLSLATR